MGLLHLRYGPAVMTDQHLFGTGQPCSCGSMDGIHLNDCDRVSQPPSDAPQEGRPTTPQTEAGRRLFVRPPSWDERDRLAADILAIEREAAAGALPSVTYPGSEEQMTRDHDDAGRWRSHTVAVRCEECIDGFVNSAGTEPCLECGGTGMARVCPASLGGAK
jgi:hypothetical protein